MKFGPNSLNLDLSATINALERAIKRSVTVHLRRKGAVLGLSGGIDSSVCAALCVRALGKERVFALFMPERDSSPDSLRLGRMVAETLGIDTVVEDIAPTIDAAGCYTRQTEAIQSVFPQYGPGWKNKVVMPSILAGDRLNIPRLTVETPDGKTFTERLPGAIYLQLIAATNFKQRTRKMLEYYHADRLNYAVCGTPNRLEYDQGFFVKNGDGAADFKPIAHLYKTQVYALARALGIPDEICRRPPTTDTFSMAQTQEEFYFALPYQSMDLCLYAHNNGISSEETAEATGLTPEQVTRVFHDIEAKRRATLPIQLPPLLAGEVPEISQQVAETVSSAKN